MKVYLLICLRIKNTSLVMARTMLIDTGAVVAALIKRDQHHEWARSNFESLSSPCLTCEAVLSESFFLLGRSPSGKKAFSALLAELHQDSTVFTTDNDFKTYRRNGRQSIPLLAPW
ncbi:MAG: PIN domain-containing protein [Proteobacteria bacterium]|nr:PIN domain-containing protein [Pseudomonadota bacterium]